MSEVKYYSNSVDGVLKATHDLCDNGATMGSDFDFRWIPTKYQGMFEVKEQSHAVFTFYTGRWETWFTLKYL